MQDDEGHYEPEPQPRDAAIDEAIDRVNRFLSESPNRLFYSTQIETALEREFFHWITGKALLELGNARAIQRTTVAVHGTKVNFYAHPKHRYWRRELKAMVALLERVFDPEFAQAIGRHGELMFDAALGRVGFRAPAKNTNAWNGKTWTETAHNLDRIITRDNLDYGVEVKNTQNYISRDELRTKIRLCQHLDLTPLFIMRFAPKSYVHDVWQAGGFTLLFEHQLYPFGSSELLTAVRNTLGLKIHSPRDVPDGHIQRLLNWHNRRLRA